MKVFGCVAFILFPLRIGYICKLQFNCGFQRLKVSTFLFFEVHPKYFLLVFLKGSAFKWKRTEGGMVAGIKYRQK